MTPSSPKSPSSWQVRFLYHASFAPIGFLPLPLLDHGFSGHSQESCQSTIWTIIAIGSVASSQSLRRLSPSLQREKQLNKERIYWIYRYDLRQGGKPRCRSRSSIFAADANLCAVSIGSLKISFSIGRCFLFDSISPAPANGDAPKGEAAAWPPLYDKSQWNQWNQYFCWILDDASWGPTPKGAEPKGDGWAPPKVLFISLLLPRVCVRSLQT